MAGDNDLTNRTQEELAEMARFPEMNPGPVCRLDLDGIIKLANPAARALFGEENLNGRLWIELCPGMAGEFWQRVLVSEKPEWCEAEIKDRWVMFTFVRAPTGRSIFAFGTDITGRKAAERKAAEQAEQLRETARFPDMNPGPVMRLDRTGCVLMANVAARDLFGQELMGQNWLQLCPAAGGAFWAGVLATERPVPLDARMGDKDFMYTHRHDVESELVFVYGTDVTAQRTAERALRQSEKMATLGTLVAGVAHELNNPAAAARRAAEQLRDALTTLEAAHVKLDEVALSDESRELMQTLEHRARESASQPSDLSAMQRSDMEAELEDWLDEHAVNEPWEVAPSLVAQGMTRELLDELSDSMDTPALNATLMWAASAHPVYTLINEIRQSASRVSEIVGALKNYSYLGQAPVQAVDVHEGLDNTLIILRSKLKRGVNVTRKYDRSLPRISAWGGDLNQVWTNILDNAVDALDGQGEIVIRTSSSDGQVQVEIEDNGPGIPQDVVTRVFDPFFTTKPQGKGTGLGLATSHSIITEKHKGRIFVESRPGMTRFTVQLPIDAIVPAESAGAADDSESEGKQQ